MKKTEIFYKTLNIEKIDKNIKIDKVVMNSKEIKKGDLFVAIRGGNNFVNEALQNGAFVVYDNKEIKIDNQHINKAFFVEDSVEFLQKFAKNWREELNIKVIGITGSNGKTTVKDMIFNILTTKYKGKKTEGNYNNHIGLPYTLLGAEETDDFIILEMGMSDFKEIELLAKICKPNISVITNIGESHLEYLKTKENVFKAKTELIPYTENVLVINGDDDYLKNINGENLLNENNKKITVCKALNINKNEILEKSRNFYYGDINFNEIESSFYLQYFGKVCKRLVERNYKTNVLGEHNILNLVMAIAVAKNISLEDKYIEKAIKNIVLTNMRFQKIEKENIIYINDAYNASPASMKKSLETFSNIYNEKNIKKIAVLGDMLELGENELKYHSDLSETIKDTNVENVYLYGSRMKSLYEKLEKMELDTKIIKYFDEKNDIIKEIENIKEKKAILVKASRGMKLEEIIV